MTDEASERAEGLHEAGMRQFGAFESLAAFIRVGVCFGVLLASPATAQMLKCERHSLADEDARALQSVARHLLLSAASIESLGPCRNPNSAHAWISTRKTTSAEGVQQWWELSCRRRLLPWHCDPPEFKQLIDTQVHLDDQERHVALNFDKNTSLSEAQSHASQALTLYVDPEARLAECSSGSVEEAAWAKIREINRLPEKARPLQVTVTRNSGVSSVALDDIQIEIRFPFEVGAPTPCWTAWIVVT
jgi:hypothetical protein